MKSEYKQVSVDVEAEREALKAEAEKKNAAPAHAPSPAAAAHAAAVQIKQQEAPATAAEPINSAFAKPVSPVADTSKPAFTRDPFAHVPTGRYIPKDQLGDDDEPAKKKKFFGLF